MRTREILKRIQAIESRYGNIDMVKLLVHENGVEKSRYMKVQDAMMAVLNQDAQIAFGTFDYSNYIIGIEANDGDDGFIQAILSTEHTIPKEELETIIETKPREEVDKYAIEEVIIEEEKAKEKAEKEHGSIWENFNKRFI